jgi:S-methylmethionine transporter
MVMLRRIAVHMPVSGSFGAYAAKYIGPSTGYMVSWLYWLTWTATLGTEFYCGCLTDAGMVSSYFDVDLDTYLCSHYFSLNLSSTKIFC